MAVGFEIEGQDLEDIYVKWSEVPYYEGILNLSNTIPGGMWSWGNNLYGMLGQGVTTTSKSSPVQIGSLTTWAKMDGGNYFAGAIKTDGTLWTWGDNSYGQLGNAGGRMSSPIQVGSLTNWRLISCGYNFAAAVKSDGTLWAWGQNNYGQIGVGSTADKYSPTQVGTLSTWKNVSCGNYHVLALQTDGSLWSCGDNTLGKLATGSVSPRSTPVRVGALNDWKDIEAGGYGGSFAIKTDGTLWAWGQNDYGQLGLGNTTPRSSPAQVGSLQDWVQISAGDNHALAIKSGGSLWAWGNNSQGQLGDGTTVAKSSPIQIGSLNDWSRVSANAQTSSAIKADGSVWTWGENGFGQLGLGTAGPTTRQSSPTRVGALTNWKSVNVSQGGNTFVLAVQY